MENNVPPKRWYPPDSNTVQISTEFSGKCFPVKASKHRLTEGWQTSVPIAWGHYYVRGKVHCNLLSFRAVETAREDFATDFLRHFSSATRLACPAAQPRDEHLTSRLQNLQQTCSI
jgi:hypothetical protein